jgi:hypothetical protein
LPTATTVFVFPADETVADREQKVGFEPTRLMWFHGPGMM